MHTKASENHAVHEPHNLSDAARRLAQRFMSGPRDAPGMITFSVSRSLEMDPLTMDEIEATQQALALRTTCHVETEARIRGVRAVALPLGVKPARHMDGHEVDADIVEWM